MNKITLSLLLFAFSFVTYEGTTYAANDMIMPGMLMVINEFHYPVSYVALSLSYYLLGNAILQLFLGPLAERFGKRKVIIFGNALFLLFTLFLALSSNMPMFLLGRVLQGTGLAFISMGYAIIHENFNDKDAVKLTAIMANVSILAPIIGPLVGGLIIHYSMSWRYVFVCSFITGSFSLLGLWKFTPTHKTPLIQLNFKEIINIYINILKTPSFLLGSTTIGFMVMPCMLWIAIAPTLIMKTLNLPLHDYVFYQIIAIGGFLISTIMNQIFAGKITMVNLIKCGTVFSMISLIMFVLFYKSIMMVSIALCVGCIGLGLQNGTMFRIIGKLPVKSQSMLFSLSTFIQIVIMTVFIELTNKILTYFNFSLQSFVIACAIFATIAIFMTFKFISKNITRNWQ